MAPCYENYNQFKQERDIREDFASKCLMFDFDGAIKICQKNENKISNLINSTRPSSNKFYTALHQASWQRNDVAISKLLKNGAKTKVFNCKGDLPSQTYHK